MLGEHALVHKVIAIVGGFLVGIALAFAMVVITPSAQAEKTQWVGESAAAQRTDSPWLSSRE